MLPYEAPSDDLAKVGVEGSNPFARSKTSLCSQGLLAKGHRLYPVAFLLPWQFAGFLAGFVAPVPSSIRSRSNARTGREASRCAALCVQF